MSSVLSFLWGDRLAEDAKAFASQHAADVGFAVLCALLSVVVIGGLHANARMHASVVREDMQKRASRTLREVARLLVVCEQDADTFQRFIHAHEAYVRVKQVRALVLDSESEALLGVRMHELFRDVEMTYSKALEDLYKAHPAIKPASKHALMATQSRI